MWGNNCCIFSFYFLRSSLPEQLNLKKHPYYSINIRDGNPPNFWTGFGFLQKSVQKMADFCGFRKLIFGGFRILAIFIKLLKKNLSATYLLKFNVLDVLFNSLPRIEPD